MVALPEQDTRIQVVIVDDQVLVAEALHIALSADDDLNVVGTVTTPGRGVEMVAATLPDVVIVGHRPPEMNGPRLAEAIWRRWPEIKTVMLVENEAPELLAHALDAGCSALFAKDRPMSDLITTVARAHRGECVLRTDDLRHLVGRSRQPSTPSRDVLSERELTVLSLVAKAESISAISSQLYVSPHTVRHHIQNILRKLDAHSRLEAVAIAMRERILPLEELDSPDEVHRAVPASFDKTRKNDPLERHAGVVRPLRPANQLQMAGG